MNFFSFFLLYSLFDAGNITKEVGPVNMTFTIPMYNASKLQVRYYVEVASCTTVFFANKKFLT